MSRDIMLLIGQSNMAGRADPIADASKPSETTKAAVEPLHNDKKTAGVGLSMSCVTPMQRTFPKRALASCQRPSGHTAEPMDARRDLYERALGIAQEALQRGKLKAILWHQGETDAQTLEVAQSYGQRLAEMVSALRQALDATNVPFIVGGLGDFLADHPTCVHYGLVNDALQNLNVDRCGFASAAGLGEFDGIHFNSAALRLLGQRYATELLRLVGK